MSSSTSIYCTASRSFSDEVVVNLHVESRERHSDRQLRKSLSASNDQTVFYSLGEDSEKKFLSYLMSLPLQSYRSIKDYYYVFDQLDEGGYGIVYLAENLRNGQQVALKRPKGNIKFLQTHSAWKNEFMILAQCNHPNIMKFIENVKSSDGSSIYMVFEYLPYSLSDIICQRIVSLHVVQIRFLMKQILEGVAYLHANKIIHRDLKPSNLLCSEYGILKVADFGLAIKSISPRVRRFHKFGTRFYRSIEQLTNCKWYTSAIDIWAVGCIFAEFFNRKCIFPFENEIDMIVGIFDICGRPVYPDLIHVNALVREILSHFPKKKKIRLRQFIHRQMSNDAYDLLRKMLTYNPAYRITAEAALKHEYFTSSAIDYDAFSMSTFLKDYNWYCPYPCYGSVP